MKKIPDKMRFKRSLESNVWREKGPRKSSNK